MEVDLPTGPDVALDDGEAGLGILVRLRGRPVDFFLLPLTPDARVTADTLDEIIGSRSPSPSCDRRSRTNCVTKKVQGKSDHHHPR